MEAFSLQEYDYCADLADLVGPKSTMAAHHYFFVENLLIVDLDYQTHLEFPQPRILLV